MHIKKKRCVNFARRSDTRAKERQLYYMGRTAQDFAESHDPNGVHHIASKGIAGRAVFVDWYAWALEQGKDVDVTTPYAVPFSDILIIRFGYLRQYADMGDDKRARLNEHYKNHKPDNIGIEPSKEFLQFLWDTQIAAVAGDTRSFEVWPCSQLDWHLHEWLLAGWGMPIGELFDLEELAKICASTGRYTFFLSSAPMNAPGAVASPPNALAFF
ncbi:hypothetical protein KC340_g13455 [Hortaea werneckii]|nr:hypothetical protein KC342_g13713 [Hortaea werneckii]KAI7072148.1 hypothetical protein KC339_g14348 [Hortaea werneckii]KAI7224835.1 hypothetical protein KC365_g10383 [Hortaea werneckii]KAI7300180.1 hypothetical protein KC340_g13455 [Hortaea werneckii]KAI7388374.1 hypothetical protein KC328_g8970 [Hortaea werneckii]